MRALIMAVFVGIFICSPASADLQEQEVIGLDKLIARNNVAEYDAIKSVPLEQVFDASFFKVKITRLFHDNGSYEEITLLKHAGEFAELTSANQLAVLVKPSFLISSLEEAQLFESTLDKLFPNEFSPNDKEIYQQDNQWVFVRMDWFGEKKGVVVTVDSQGVISSIENKEDLK